MQTNAKHEKGRMHVGVKKCRIMLLPLIMNTKIADFNASAFIPSPHVQQNNYHHLSSLSSSDNNVLHQVSTSANTSTKRPFQLQRIDHIVIRCNDFPRMFDFYTRILGCTIDEPRSDNVNRFGGALTHLRVGSCYIDLLSFDTHHLTDEGKEFAARSFAGGRGLVDSKRVDDLCLSADSSTLDHLCICIEPFNENNIKKYLKKQNVTIVAAGEGRLGADGIGPSVYVSDPEGNVIELKGKSVPVAKGGIYSSIDTNNDEISTGTIASNSVEETSSTFTSTNNDGQAESTPMTPCNRICRYNRSFYNGQVCIGCFREEYEIKMWQSMTAAEKSLTLLDQIDRCAEVEKNGKSFDGAVTTEELKRQYNYWAALSS